MNSDKIILVTGAAGQQGGATAHHLLTKGWRVRALTRDTRKSAAQALAQAGAELVQGDNDDKASLEAAVKGAYGVFAVQNFWLPNVGAEGEIRQGKLIADVAKAAGIQHFVYSSVGGAERNSGIPHFESKWQIEQHIRALNLPATILRPVAFMDNYYQMRPAILNGTFPSFGLRPNKTLQVIAADDIGALVALAFEKPSEFMGKAIEIAGDELIESQMAVAFSRVIGRPVQLAAMQYDPSQPPDPEMMKMGMWMNEKGYKADIPALRALYPQLMNFETWLRKTGWENAEPVPEQAQAAWGSS